MKAKMIALSGTRRKCDTCGAFQYPLFTVSPSILLWLIVAWLLVARFVPVSADLPLENLGFVRARMRACACSC